MDNLSRLWVLKSCFVRCDIPCGAKFCGFQFLRFPGDPQKIKVPADKNYRKHFSRKNLLQSKCTIL